MPLQRIETVDEPRARIEAQGSLFDATSAHLDDFRNMLVWGDNKLVMSSLLRDFRGKVDMIYVDPPFDVGADFSMSVPFGEENEQVQKEQSLSDGGPIGWFAGLDMDHLGVDPQDRACSVGLVLWVLVPIWIREGVALVRTGSGSLAAGSDVEAVDEQGGRERPTRPLAAV